MVINNITSRIYNTGLKSATEINEEFVVRTKEFEAIWEDLKTSTMQFPEQDYFIVGERGMGKTMLLAKIKIAVQQDKKLSKWLIPVAYPEEQNNVTELYDLWLNTAAYLGEKHPELFEDLNQQLEDLEINEATEEEAFKMLNDTLNQEKKKLILLIDNFDEILKNIPEKENRRLREIMITNNNLRIIGASANAMEHNFRYDKAFYDHFAEIKLQGLTREETKQLFDSKINKIENEEKVIKYKQHKLETLRQLSGGNIRNLIIFFDILLKNKNSSLMEDLGEVLERVTPYNLDKIKTLKNKQRKIIDFLAKAWDGTFVKEIADGTRMESNEVSSQLNALIENQIVCAKNSSTRKKLYFIRDRFLNIWYLMRNSTLANKDSVIWLVKVYESFYSLQFDEKQSYRTKAKRPLKIMFCLLEDGKIEDSLSIAKKQMANVESLDKFHHLIADYPLLLLSYQQYYVVKNYFDENRISNLKQRYKPIWYTLMHCLKDDYPDEFLKMGSELKDTVEDMIERVEEMKIKYQ